MNSGSLIPEMFIGFEVLMIIFHNAANIKKASRSGRFSYLYYSFY